MVSNAWLKDPPFYGCEKRRKIHLSLDVKKKKNREQGSNISDEFRSLLVATSSKLPKQTAPENHINN
jgi:hypothetical protein